MRKTLTLLAPLFALGACDIGDDPYAFPRWDGDANGEISFEEFTSGFETTFSRWDQNNDDLVEVAEFGNGLFSDWDRDRSGVVTEAEFNDRFFGGTFEQLAEFDRWDANGDTWITRDELVAGWQESGMFDQWDQDAEPGLSMDELATGLFEGWDGDTSDSLSEEEFGFAIL